MFQCYDQVSYTQKIPSYSLTLLLESSWQPGRLQFRQGKCSPHRPALLVLIQQHRSMWLGTSKLILFPNNCPESRKCNYYSVTSVRLLTGKPPRISKSGVQVEFHSVKLHKSMTCESVLYLVCSIPKPSVILKSVLQRAVQKELQQPPFHT